MKASYKLPSTLTIAFLSIFVFSNSQAQTLSVTGELKKWHPVTITLDGPQASEDGNPNPFLDYRFEISFSLGAQTITVPGYFAADGNAAETGATSGNKWRVHFVPPQTGNWTYRTSFRQGSEAALSTDPNAGSPLAPYDGIFDSISIGETDKGGDDFRGKGTLRYIGERYLRFDNGEYFLKVGADSPENFLAYTEFDGTYSIGGNFVRPYSEHIGDWNSGDPVWQGDNGKGIIGAVNYLASEGINSIYMITMNIEGDGRDVWMYPDPNNRTRYDVSKLAQWDIVFNHMHQKGMAIHILTQETENELLLDGGGLGTQRKSYFRELVARFGYHHAVVWNLGEENDENTDSQRKSFADYIRAFDAYDHPIVIHTYPYDWDEVYGPFLGYPNFEGPSIQIGGPTDAHWVTLDWINKSAAAGKKWTVTIDESGPWQEGVHPDGPSSNQGQMRREVLWGNIMAGGAGVEWYFGYNFPHNDLNLTDFRSRDRWWDYNRYAHEFFTKYLPFTEMSSMDNLSSDDNSYVFAKEGSVYAVYLKYGGSPNLTINGSSETFSVQWFNPRNGGELVNGTVLEVTGPGTVSIGQPPSEQSEDWVALIGDAQSSNLYGDVSGDGQVSAFDASLTLQHAIGLIVLPGNLTQVADVSGNGSVSAFDGSMILQEVIDLIACFPADPQCAGKTSAVLREAPELSWQELSTEATTRSLTLTHAPGSELSQAIDLDIQYNPSQYVLDSYEYTLPSDWQVVVNETEGRLQIAGAGLQQQLLAELVNVHLRPKADALSSGPIQAFVSLDESSQGIASLVDEIDVPSGYTLSGNYPNPFNPETTIQYSLPEASQVHLEVFDLTGRSVAVLVDNASQVEGEYTVTFDASHLPSGIYVYRLEANNFQQTRKMTLLK